MARFNEVQKPEMIVNRAGGEAFEQSPELALVSILLTSFMKDQFYRSAQSSYEDLLEVLCRVDSLFAAKAAVFARNEFGMRTVSHIVAGEIGNSVKGEKWTKRFFEKVIRRPDDATEILAYIMIKYGRRPIPNSVKRGFIEALCKFDEYQIAKYQGKTKKLSLVDVVNLITGRRSDLIGSEAISKLTRGILKPAETWETKLTQAGQEAESVEDLQERKQEVWTNLIKKRKIGYFALLKNLRNILFEAPEVLDDALDMLVNPNLIRKSLVFPFRYMVAQYEIEKLAEQGIDGATKVLGAISRAIDTSLCNVPSLPGKTVVVVDQSGSMYPGFRYNQGAEVPIVTASIFGAALAKANGADIVGFSNHANYISYNPADSVLTIARHIIESGEKSGTDFHSIFHVLNKSYNRIIILSDEQGWVGYKAPTNDLVAYKRIYKCKPILYSIDLTGYGDMQFKENSVVTLAGFSDKIFNLMELAETDLKVLLKRIKEVRI